MIARTSHPTVVKRETPVLPDPSPRLAACASCLVLTASSIVPVFLGGINVGSGKSYLSPALCDSAMLLSFSDMQHCINHPMPDRRQVTNHRGRYQQKEHTASTTARERSDTLGFRTFRLLISFPFCHYFLNVLWYTSRKRMHSISQGPSSTSSTACGKKDLMSVNPSYWARSCRNVSAKVKSRTSSAARTVRHTSSV